MYAREVFESEIDIKFEAGTAEYFCKCRGGEGRGGSLVTWSEEAEYLVFHICLLFQKKLGGGGLPLRRPCEFFTRQEECVKVFKK